jgi:hypothetical protein
LSVLKPIPRSFRSLRRQFDVPLLYKFPFSVYFIVAGDLASVVAVVHQRKEPIDWRRRR